jgi:hypothetical protein
LASASSSKSCCFVFRDIGIQAPLRHIQISDRQQNWGYEDGPWRGPEPSLLLVADLIHKPLASIRLALIKYALAVTEEPFNFSPTEPVAYELSHIATTRRQ